MVERSVAGLPDTLHNDRIHETAMSPAEAVEHLLQVRAAFAASLRGESWDWSQPFSSGIESLDDRISALKEQTASLLEKVDFGNAQQVESLIGYFPAHDNYHVGQICQLRMAREPEFNPYSIYNH